VTTDRLPVTASQRPQPASAHRPRLGGGLAVPTRRRGRLCPRAAVTPSNDRPDFSAYVSSGISRWQRRRLSSLVRSISAYTVPLIGVFHVSYSTNFPRKGECKIRFMTVFIYFYCKNQLENRRGCAMLNLLFMIPSLFQTLVQLEGTQ